MSGFAVALAPQGGAIDPADAAHLRQAIARLGPDRQATWDDGRVWMSHALLQTTPEEAHDRQPLSLDGSARLVGDIRLDGRRDLLRQLAAAGRKPPPDCPDSELLLHAFAVWGEACVDRLIGDFAFAIWDARRQRLFCARDQFGTVPLYYARIGAALVIANDMAALLSLPGFDRELDRRTLGDYLLFGNSYDPARGFFRGARRLPPAHVMRADRAGEVEIARYWHAPQPAPVRMDREEAVARFEQVAVAAVKDRLRTASIAVSLSGGVDSTLVAALAVRHAPPGTRVEAYTSVSEWLMPDPERAFARRAAEYLGIAHREFALEAILVDPPDGRHFRSPPEPRFWLNRLPTEGMFEQMVADGHRTMLTGHGGDAIVAGGLHGLGEAARRRDIASLLRIGGAYHRHFGRRPPIRLALRRRQELIAGTPFPDVPLRSEAIAELDLTRRWAEIQQLRSAPDPRLNLVLDNFWPELLSGMQPETLGLPLKMRSPLVDVRLLELAMQLPVAPWQFDKEIMRLVLDRLMPPEIARRRKTAFGANAYRELALQGRAPWLAPADPVRELDLIDYQRLAALAADPASLDGGQFLRSAQYPLGLLYWFHRIAR